MEEKLQIIRGDDASFVVELTDVDDVPIDLTDCTLFFTAKRRKTDADADAAVALDITDHTDPTAGESRIMIPKETTTDLRLGDYFWDLQIKYPNGTIQSSIYDTLVVIPDITLRTSEGELS